MAAVADPAPAPSRRLLRTNPTFRRYWLARATSLVGDGSVSVALLLYASAGEDGARAVGLLLLAQSLPRFFGPLAGALADRREQTRLMVLMDVGQAALFALLAVTLPPIPLLVLVVLVATSLSTVFDSAGRSTLPSIVPRQDLMSANGWLGTAFNFQGALGPVIGGALVGLFGIRWALAVNAATFLVSALLLSGLPPMRTQEERDGMGSYLSDVRAGFRYVREHRVARLVTLLLVTAVFFGSLDNVALVFLAREELHAGAAGFGVLAAAFGGAMVLASLFLVRPVEGRRPSRVLLLGWLLTGGGLFLTGLAPVLAVAVLTQAIGGVGNGFTNVAEDTLVQHTVEQRFLGRVHGLLSSAAFLGSTLAYLLGGFLFAELLTPRQLFLVAGGGVVVMTVLIATRLTPELEDAAQVHEADPDEGAGVAPDAG